MIVDPVEDVRKMLMMVQSGGQKCTDKLLCWCDVWMILLICWVYQLVTLLKVDDVLPTPVMLWARGSQRFHRCAFGCTAFVADVVIMRVQEFHLCALASMTIILRFLKLYLVDFRHGFNECFPDPGGCGIREKRMEI